MDDIRSSLLFLEAEMTIQEVMTEVDSISPNTIDEGLKMSWLNSLEEMIYKEVICTHEGHESVPIKKLTMETDYEEKLTAEAPYDRLYVFYLLSKIDYANHEWTDYNSTSEMFNQAYKEYKAYYNRNHMPVQKVKGYGK